MKTPGRTLVASVLVAAAGLATAQDRPSDASSAAPAQGGASVSASKGPRKQVLTGTLVAFDVERATVTFKDESGKSLTWPVEARLAENARAYAEMRLQTLKEGDRVWIIYVAQAGGGPRVYDVRPAVRRGTGQERREGEDPPAKTPAPTAPAPPAPPR